MSEGVRVLWFSPNGGTRQAAQALAPMLGRVEHEWDATPLEARYRLAQVPKDSLLLVALPVYHGRLPGVSEDIFAHLRAAGAQAAGLLTLGGGGAGKAPDELVWRLQQAGLGVLGVALLARPHDGLEATAAELLERRRNGRVLPPAADPGLTEVYRWSRLIETDGRCVRCGGCVKVCPVAAIDPAAPHVTDHMRCLGCRACVNACPKGARAVAAAARG